jgi:molybdate transport system permease protein
MLAGNIPGETQTLPLALYFSSERGHDGEALFWLVTTLVVALAGVALSSWAGRSERLRRVIPFLLRRRTRAQRTQSEELPARSYHLKRRYPQFELDARFELPAGRARVVGIVGPSGAGKSMLLRQLRRLEKDCAVVFQSPGVFPHLTAEENVSFTAGRGQSARWLDRVRFPRALFGEFPSRLSGGLQQRVALARALACAPPTLLLDEPIQGSSARSRASFASCCRPCRVGSSWSAMRMIPSSPAYVTGASVSRRDAWWNQALSAI